jgi:UDP-N-acetylmuramoylalanine--D-glutamate ligase
MIRVTTFAGRDVAVFGLGASGTSTARALLQGGASVHAWDDGAAGREAAARDGVPIVDLAEVDWSKFAALVLAPGVPLTHPEPHWVVKKAKEAGVEIIGDIELFCREREKVCPEAPVIAVTGTNGKSTTTALIAHILQQAGRDTQMGGNIGRAVLTLDAPEPGRHYVIEMSSFQIDLTPSLAPSVGVLLNVTPDHIDRHGSLEHYAAVKARLIEHARNAVIGVGDPFGQSLAEFRRIADQRSGVRSLRRIAANPGADVEFGFDGRYVVANDGHEKKRIADLSGVGALRGLHNAENACAAAAALTMLPDPLSPEEIGRHMRSYPGLAHRMEEIGSVGRVLFVNDSKATNADSTEKALTSFAGPIYWIAGGRPKSGGIEPLAPHFGRVARAYLIGEAAPQFAVTLGGKVPFEQCGTLAIALQRAASDAAASTADEPVVLLSPACASYDQFKNFEVRGDAFRSLVAALPGIKLTGKRT